MGNGVSIERDLILYIEIIMKTILNLQGSIKMHVSTQHNDIRHVVKNLCYMEIRDTSFPSNLLNATPPPPNPFSQTCWLEYK
jgi:hypothetical protein